MRKISHCSAKASHYDVSAKNYDEFNEKRSAIINRTIENILKKHGVKTVLDLTCGTGSQVFWLAKRGYDVVGSDINKKMLKIAKAKAKENKAKIKFTEGDMRTTYLGEFDAVVTIFNAVGHLTKRDFEKSMRNIYKNLNSGGLYIFDIFNLNYLAHANNITDLTIDWQEKNGDTKVRKIQYSTIDEKGILASYTTACEQNQSGQLKIEQDAQTLQIYTLQQLKNMLQKNGFKVIKCCGLDAGRFSEKKTESMLIVAKKQE